MQLFETEKDPIRANSAGNASETPSSKALASIKAAIPALAHDDAVAAASALMDAIPETRFEGIDVGSELLLQFQVVKALQSSLLDDTSVPANQRAQVANAVAGTLQAITVAQSKFYTSERFKRIEQALIKTMNAIDFPERLKVAFFGMYEKLNANAA